MVQIMQTSDFNTAMPSASGLNNEPPPHGMPADLM